VPPYSVPFEDNCHDELDNDGDGVTDCDDPDCYDSDDCGIPVYMAAFLPPKSGDADEDESPDDEALV